MEKLADPFRADKSSYAYAKETAILIRDIFKQKLDNNFESVDGLLDMIKKMQKMLTSTNLIEFSIENIIKRVTSIVKEQAKLLKLEVTDKESDVDSKLSRSAKNIAKYIRKLGSLHPSLKQEDISKDPKSDAEVSQMETNITFFKNNVLQALDEIIDEFETLSIEMNESAAKHINSNEMILTFGDSYTVTMFLIEAAKKKTFEVVIAEGNLQKNGHKMAERLAEHKIKSTVIPDTAIYAIMPRVHKVLISCNSIMANGGILTPSGGLALAMACKAHLVPFIVVGGIYKLTHKISFEQDTYNDLINPGQFFKVSEDDNIENIDVVVPALDYIGPEFVTLYITNLGEHTPAYLYRIFSEYYVKE